ncbi:hypothetical protein RHOSPDRAFT_32555 [Rhodotorula sp. JG-1b]|nr:hypothetical protein RHOSPDRAFT_32555 [Rhodotorula sp. JG-1b]
MTLVYAGWTMVMYNAYATAASVRGSNAPAAFDELALSTRFHICTSLFCATMTLLCLGALATSAFPQQDAAKWLSRAIWVGWLCTWGFGVFGLTNFVASDIFLATFCTAAACGTSPETLRLTMIFVVFFTLALVFYLAVVLSAYVHTLHPHIFMSPDSDTEDEYSDPDEGFQRKLEGHLVSIGEPHLSEYLAARALRHGTLEEKPARSESRRRVPYSSRQQESDISEEDETPGARPVAKVSPRPVASRSSLTDSSGSSSTYRQQPRPGSNAGRSYQRGHTADENLSTEGESSADEGPQLYDAPRKSTRS